MARDELIRRVWEFLEPELHEQGYELVELECARHGRRRIFRVFLDKEGGVSLDDCTAVSPVIGALLDGSDLIEGRYILEISSPGFDRPLRKPSDFERFIGEKVKVKTFAPVSGRKQFKGTLKSFDQDMIEIDCQGMVYSIHTENLRKANLDR